MYKCKICKKTFTELQGLYNHIERKHINMIPENMSVEQYYYFMKTGKVNGNCVMCKQPTSWNKNTNKYNRFCDNPKCKEKYVEEFRKRMIGKYGKVHLLNDPEKQREMLANRSISGKYKWDDGTETVYTGGYEHDFLKMMDGFFDWDPSDIMMPSPHNYIYKYNGEEKFYIPDVFIPSLNLEIEIKDGGDNPNMHYKIQDVDKVKEKNKDEVMTSQKSFHYIKITNKNYTNFFNFLKEIKTQFEKYGDENKIPRIFKIEDIKTGSSNAKVLKEAGYLTFSDLWENVADNITNGKVNDTLKKIQKVNVRDLEKITNQYIKFADSSEGFKAMRNYSLSLMKKSKSKQDILYMEALINKVSHKLTDEYQKGRISKNDVIEFNNWLNKDFKKELYKKKDEYMKENFDYLEEKFEPDKALVWLEKPIKKLIGGKIKLYHGSSVKMKGNVIDPISINVGATKYSEPRWSTYFWDNREDAMLWASCWAIMHTVGPKNIMYRGHNGKTAVRKLENMDKKDMRDYLVKNVEEFYIYEVEVDINDLEIGSCPTIREYTVSKPVTIEKTYTYKLNSEIIKRCVEFVDDEQYEKYDKEFTVSNLPLHRNMFLRNILKNGKDLYRAIVRTDIQNGNINIGDDLSDYKKSINNHFKSDTYGYFKESYEDIVNESSISYQQLNNALQADTDDRIKEYMRTYDEYYKRMMKEKPDMSNHINDDVNKAIRYINDLKYSNRVNRKLADIAIRQFKNYGDTKKYISENTDINTCDDAMYLYMVFDPNKRRQLFMLNDADTKLFFGDDTYISREMGKVHLNGAGSCAVHMGDLNEEKNGKRVIKYQLMVNNPMCLGTIIECLKNEKHVRINSLYKINDSRDTFMDELKMVLKRHCSIDVSNIVQISDEVYDEKGSVVDGSSKIE